MNNVADRIKNIISREGITQRGLAEKLNVTPQTVNNWIKRDSISKEAAEQISSALGYSLDWILQGAGVPKKESVESIPDEKSWGKVSPWDRNTPLDDGEVEVHFLKDIEFACGDGTFGSEDHNGLMLRFSKSTLRRVGANSDGSGVLCFPATGSSMEPIIPDGTTVAVDTNNKKIIDGKLYAINHGGLKRIKQLYKLPNDFLSVRSFNKDEYEDQNVFSEDIEIIGRVFWYSVLI